MYTCRAKSTLPALAVKKVQLHERLNKFSYMFRTFHHSQYETFTKKPIASNRTGKELLKKETLVGLSFVKLDHTCRIVKNGPRW